MRPTAYPLAMSIWVSVPSTSAAMMPSGSSSTTLSIWHDDRDAVVPALVRAMATGANVAMSAGLGDLALVDELAGQIEVEVVE